MSREFFELNRLVSYDDDALVAELRRVAALIESPVMTKAAFDQLARASSSFIRRRFGSWEKALLRANLSDRYSGGSLAPHKPIYSDDELLAELRRISQKLNGQPVTTTAFDQHASMCSATVRERFGSWQIALKRAGLQIARLGIRHSDDDYFENLLTVWTYHGRQPKYGEMSNPPSQISANAYERKWGKWRSALLAFMERVNSDTSTDVPKSSPTVPEKAPITKVMRRLARAPRKMSEDQRSIKLGLRYEVLKRDRFRCVLCGASPATILGCILHVDHVIPFSKSGKTVSENLRSLCGSCNLGKGAKMEGWPVKEMGSE